jgi:hypothetical protein
MLIPMLRADVHLVCGIVVVKPQTAKVHTRNAGSDVPQALRWRAVMETRPDGFRF